VRFKGISALKSEQKAGFGMSVKRELSLGCFNSAKKIRNTESGPTVTGALYFHGPRRCVALTQTFIPSPALGELTWNGPRIKMLTDWLQFFVAEFCAD
jgi:hypothetical protein